MAVQKKKVTESCRDIRVAMDGGFAAQIESGGLSPSTELTIYQEHNRKRIKLGTIPVVSKANPEGLPSYEGAELSLVIHGATQKATGRQLASLTGKINGAPVSATLGCEN
jgi:hypothetical protein